MMQTHPKYARLTPSDIKILKYDCRPGIFIPLGIFLLAFIITFLSFLATEQPLNDDSIEKFTVIILPFIVIAILIGRLLTRKNIKDIRNGEKELVIKTIKRKVHGEDYESGSGAIVGSTMKAFIYYRIQIDNHLYDIDEKMFMDCQDGDEVVLHTAPLSRKILSIELKK